MGIYESTKAEEKAQELKQCSLNPPTRVLTLPSFEDAENVEGTSMGNSVIHSSTCEEVRFAFSPSLLLVCRFYATSNVIVKF